MVQGTFRMKAACEIWRRASAEAAAKAVGGASATGINASGEGSGQSDIIVDSFNLLNGWERIFTDAERIEIPGGASFYLYMRLPSAPGSSTTFDADLTFGELG